MIEADPSEYPNELTAAITEMVYVGDHLRILLDSQEPGGFVVKVSNNTGLKESRKGQSVRVGWRIEDCLAFDVI